MYKNISKILICSLILVLAIGAVSATENNTADDAILTQSSDDVVAVSEDDVDVIAAEEQKEDAIAASEDQVIAASEEKEDTLTVSENEDTLKVEKQDNALSLSISDSKEKLSSYKTKVFTLAKFKFPYKYIHTSYKNLPKKMKKLYDKRYNKKLKKIKAAGWKASNEPYYKITKKGSNAYITYKLKCYKY